MDKIGIVLFKFSMERTVSKEYKKMCWIMLIPTIMLLLLDIILMFFSPTWSVLCCILCLLFLLILSKIMEGKWGTNKWKYKCMKIFQESFRLNQRKLIEIIKEEGMNCQQVYNLLTKRYSRMLQGADKRTLLLTIVSLVIACTSILASPLQNIDFKSFMICVMVILIFLAPIAYLLYKFLVAKSEQNDRKKNDYEYAIKILENYLF